MAGPRRSARLRAKEDGVSPHIHAPPQTSRSGSPTTSNLKRRKRDIEVGADEIKGERPAKQPRTCLPCPLELSEQNLKRFNREAMDSPALKRSSSRRSIALSTEADTVRSQRSSNTAAFYRYNHLAAAEVYIHADPPAGIRDAIDSVINASVSKARLSDLQDIARQLYDGCKEAVNAAVGEDDFLEIFLVALRALGHSNLCLRAKADWREDIKPTIQQSDLDLSFLVNAVGGGQQQGAEDASAPPRKRQQQYAASDSISDHGVLETDVMPPPPPPDRFKAASPIKTPRPDITLGTRHTALISALSKTLDGTRAKRFLKQLQSTMKPSEQGDPDEPLLVAVPAPRASDLVFPFAVVEGKAYSTGRQVFEAENQAAVSGASGLKIQLSLDGLVNNATKDDSGIQPASLPGTPTPLFFSVCTEGPYHELYAHYTHVEDGVRKFGQVLLEICNGVLLTSVLAFIIKVDNVMRWGTGQFLDSVVERLEKVAKKAGA
ncbi:hypothetical protein VPNG_03632 [Cytospora leucostoma]|uniref:Uncharacterized protein n=1 Tax=Cytospora leucostoma TaxID=1230097 RepID=A0A423XD33_9PEZI|nr:hypothetical protein VPNG_03632 [Cytospora leucostoma]